MSAESFPRPVPPPRLPAVPPVDYRTTAARPDWAELPAALRAEIEERLGGPVVTATTAGGGFTRGFAAVLSTASDTRASDTRGSGNRGSGNRGSGNRSFVKAADLASQHHLAEWYYHEVLVTHALPPGVPVPRPLWTATAGGWYAVCFEAVDAEMPRLPWQAGELSATLRAWAAAASALREPPAPLAVLGLPRLADVLRADLSWWQQAPPRELEQVDELAVLEAALPGYADCPGLTHCDLRPDNVLIDRSGAAWICDWNWACHGAPWFDTASLLISAYASGLDADRLFAEHPTAAGAPPDALDASLAALAGYLLGHASSDPTGPNPGDASPAIRAHQLWSGEAALAWLSDRRGWRT